jgi:hypothetical protein
LSAYADLLFDFAAEKWRAEKMKPGRGLSAIFLPAIFLPVELGLAGEPGFVNMS